MCWLGMIVESCGAASCNRHGQPDRRSERKRSKLRSLSTHSRAHKADNDGELLPCGVDALSRLVQIWCRGDFPLLEGRLR